MPTDVSGLRNFLVFNGTMSCAESTLAILDDRLGMQNLKLEQAIDPLTGGIAGYGAACGFYWGASVYFARRAEREGLGPAGIAQVSLAATRKLIDRTRASGIAVDCADFLRQPAPWRLVPYVAMVKMVRCVKHLNQLIPTIEAIADDALAQAQSAATAAEPAQPNCAVMACRSTLRALGTEDHGTSDMVAGWGGGLGCTGNGCGALGAAIFALGIKYYERATARDGTPLMRVLKSQPGVPYSNDVLLLVDLFRTRFGQLTCREIVNKDFSSPEDFGQHVRSTGCGDVMDFLHLTLRNQGILARLSGHSTSS